MRNLHPPSLPLILKSLWKFAAIIFCRALPSVHIRGIVFITLTISHLRCGERLLEFLVCRNSLFYRAIRLLDIIFSLSVGISRCCSKMSSMKNNQQMCVHAWSLKILFLMFFLSQELQLQQVSITMFNLPTAPQSGCAKLLYQPS